MKFLNRVVPDLMERSVVLGYTNKDIDLDSIPNPKLILDDIGDLKKLGRSFLRQGCNGRFAIHLELDTQGPVVTVVCVNTGCFTIKEMDAIWEEVIRVLPTGKIVNSVITQFDSHSDFTPTCKVVISSQNGPSTIEWVTGMTISNYLDYPYLEWGDKLLKVQGNHLVLLDSNQNLIQIYEDASTRTREVLNEIYQKELEGYNDTV